ncbi:hypothetical protein ACFYU8_18530 [Brevibacillus sp. NPDC003359]|uniref:hypothetical protein n=1 Tax=unclassified Brevibacillus TaxID=2684853 RepID=UPI0036C9FC17
MQQLEMIKNALLTGQMTYEVAAELVYKGKNKPWNTKEWQEIRQERIKDHCEQCKTKQEPFVLQHTRGSKPYQFFVKEKYQEIYNREIEKGMEYEVIKNEVELYLYENMEKRNVCPNCQSINIRERKTKAPKFACYKCYQEFDEPLSKEDYLRGGSTVEDIINKIGQQKIREMVWDQHGEEIRTYAILKSIEEFERYMSCIDTVTFCKKCAFLWDKKGLKLCDRCSVKYHAIARDCCRDCMES